jgi:3-oxoacyl-[acyl-carrier protein] reductase
MKRLQNKVAVVTGGGRGLGKFFCLAMADEGAKIVSADILEKESVQTAQEINDKGGSTLSLKVDVTSEKETERMNLKGLFLCSKAVFPYMKKQNKRKIINLSSETAFTGTKGLIHYVTSKGGLISFTRSPAAELALASRPLLQKQEDIPPIKEASLNG